MSYDDPTLKFMATTQTEAMLAVEVADSEYLLCFRGEKLYYIDTHREILKFSKNKKQDIFLYIFK